MACSTMRRAGQTARQREAQVRAAVARLERALTINQVGVKISERGAIAFAGWTERDDVTDACAYRLLTSEGSWALRQAVARAEAQAGRKVDERLIAAGVHSHDGGKTWGTH